MTLSEFINKALKVPFQDKGRDYAAWDCWGCVRCGLRDVGGIFLPSYTDYSSTRDYKQLNLLISLARPRWTQVNDYKPLDVALFNISGKVTHTALVIDKRRALHAEERLGTFIEPINSLMWGKRLDGVYRYTGQNDRADASV